MTLTEAENLSLKLFSNAECAIAAPTDTGYNIRICYGEFDYGKTVILHITPDKIWTKYEDCTEEFKKLQNDHS